MLVSLMSRSAFSKQGFLVTSRNGLELFGMKIMIWITENPRYFVLPGMLGGSIQAPLVEENPTNASKMTLNGIENNRYMDILLDSDSLSDLKIIAKESIDLMESGGFKLHKWVSNCHAKSILLKVPRCDLVSSVSEIDLGLQPLPDSKALGLVWDTEKDTHLVNLHEFWRGFYLSADGKPACK